MISWLRTKRDIQGFFTRWLNEIEEFRFDVEHFSGRLNPADPLTRRGFPDRDPGAARPAAAVDPSPALAAAAVDVSVSGPTAAAGPPTTSATAAVASVRPAAAAGGPAGPGTLGLPDAFTPPACAQVRLVTGAVRVTVPPNPVQPKHNFLSPGFVATWSRELLTDPHFQRRSRWCFGVGLGVFCVHTYP